MRGRAKKCGLRSSDCVNSGNNQCYELLGILILNPLILLVLVRCSCKYFDQQTLTLLWVAKNNCKYIYRLTRCKLLFNLTNVGDRFFFSTSMNVCIAANQHNNLLGFNNENMSSCRVPMFVYLFWLPCHVEDFRTRTDHEHCRNVSSVHAARRWLLQHLATRWQ